ncbi:MAG: hypothetical protein ACLVDB_04320 [Anaeromassilibacillus sp.]
MTRRPCLQQIPKPDDVADALLWPFATGSSGVALRQALLGRIQIDGVAYVL